MTLHKLRKKESKLDTIELRKVKKKESREKHGGT